MNSVEATNHASAVADVPPQLLAQWLKSGEATVIDVREDFEHAAESIPGSQNVPLSTLDDSRVRDLCGDRRVVLQCRAGKRSAEAASRFQSDPSRVFQLAGGIEGWKAAGFPTQRSARAPALDVMRQVQIIAGSLVLTGVLLGAFVSPAWLALSGFVGAGLTFAGISGWCGMAKLLARMPWNRVDRGSAGGGATCSTR